MLLKMTKKKLFITLFMLCIFTFSISVFADEYDCAAGKHKYVTTITDPTETKPGRITYKCELCGHSYSETIPAYGHEWGPWITDVKASCAKAGHKYRVCKKNPQHVEERVIPKTGKHDFEIIIRQPTHTEAGLKTYRCLVCGYTYTETIPMLPAEDKDTDTDKTDTAAEMAGGGTKPAQRSSGCALCTGGTHPNSLDYIFCSLEVLIAVILLSCIASQQRIIRWDKKLRNK